MMEEAQARALWMLLAIAGGFLIYFVCFFLMFFLFVDPLLITILSFLPVTALVGFTTWASLAQRKYLGYWMNIDDEKTDGPKSVDFMACCCAACCPCLQYSAES